MIPRVERRQFGRRLARRKGWIVVAGRPRVTCVVRNLSEAGAFLEVDTPSWVPFQFELLLDDSDASIACEFRHTRPQGIGVAFVQEVQRERPITSSADQIDEWLGNSNGKRVGAR